MSSQRESMSVVTSSRRAAGFTIVELLIVVVVIAILAAIVIVAYNGIQNRAYDAAVKNDLATIGKKLELFKVEPGRYPQNNGELETLGIKVSKSAYGTPPQYNVAYCVDTTWSVYAVSALSKSGKAFVITSLGGGPAEYAATTNDGVRDSSGSCASHIAGTVRTTAGYNAVDITTGPWRAWAGGN